MMMMAAAAAGGGRCVHSLRPPGKTRARKQFDIPMIAVGLRGSVCSARCRVNSRAVLYICTFARRKATVGGKRVIGNGFSCGRSGFSGESCKFQL